MKIDKIIKKNDSNKKSSNKKKSGLKLTYDNISSPIKNEELNKIKKQIKFNDDTNVSEEHKFTDIVKNKSNSKIQDSVNKFLNSNYYKDDIYKVINKLAPDDDKYKSLDNFVINDIKNYTRKDVITLLDLNNIKYDKENNKKELVENIVNYIKENPNKLITGYEDEKLKYKNLNNYQAYDNMKIKNDEIMNKNSNYKNIEKSKKKK